MKSPRSHLVPSAVTLADGQGGVLRISQLAEVGLTREQRRAQLSAGRWDLIPGRGVVVGRSGEDTPYWMAVVEVGRGSAIGGASALVHAGLTGWTQHPLQVWVPKSYSKDRGKRRGSVLELHETRRWTLDDQVGHGLPRSTPPVAAVQAALWSRTARQGAAIWAMSVQQGLVTPEQIGEQLDRVRRHPFRRPLLLVLGDLADGVQSINELDFARLCREHGLPEPERQVALRTEQGRIYLDVYWRRYRVRVEVNGAHHGELSQMVKDEVRSVHAQTDGDATVPVSVLTLRTAAAAFMSAMADLLRSRGWEG